MNLFKQGGAGLIILLPPLAPSILLPPLVGGQTPGGIIGVAPGPVPVFKGGVITPII
jgi:hypothetical protein